MDYLTGLLSGFENAFQLTNLLFGFLGVTLGTAIGVLPGLGPLTALAVLLPFTYTLGDPITSIIFLAGIYYGAQYGGSTSSILLNVPGEPSSAVTAIDGYQLTKQGKAGKALGIAALSSFVAGIISIAFVAILTQPISKIVFLFGPAELAMLMFIAMIAAVALTNESLLKGLGMVVLGGLIGLIGIDINSGLERFTFGIPSLMDGIPFILIACGLFGIAEIMYLIFHHNRTIFKNVSIEKIYPSRKDIADSTKPALRGTLLGSLFGLLPGPASIISAFSSYSLEKKLSKNPSSFGKGAIEGVAGPEAANNAAAQTNFIPLLALGIPTNASMALIFSSLLMFGIQPGPEIASSNSLFFWTLIASMWIGNIMLLVLNLPLIKIWTMVIKIPKNILYVTVLSLCIFGVFYVSQDWFLVMLLIPFALLGYVFKLVGCEPAPLALGFVVVNMFEEYFRRALTISQGNFDIFVSSSLSLTLLALGCIILLIPVIKFLRKKYHAKTHS